MRAVSEVFADRSYQPDGTLTPRNMPGAVITDESVAVEQALMMIEQGKVRSLPAPKSRSMREPSACTAISPAQSDSRKRYGTVLLREGSRYGRLKPHDS